MTSNSVPHLCGGILFDLLLEARMTRRKARNKLAGGSDGLANRDIYKKLIYVVTGDDGFYGESTLEKCASDFKKCVSSKGSYVPFTDASTISAFSSAVKRKDPDLLNRMSGFINDCISVSKREWLVRALIDIIQSDKDINQDTLFSIDYKKSVKASLLHKETTFILQPFLISVIDFILQYSPDAESGRSTFETLYSQAGPKAEWKYCGHLGDKIQPLTVSTDTPDEEAGTNEEMLPHQDNAELSDDEVIFENLKKPVMMFANILEAQKHQLAEQIRANNKKSETSEDESELIYSVFKRESFDLIKYCIDTDISAAPVKVTLADEIDALIDKWQFDIRKITNQGLQKIVADTLKTLSEFEVYLSDKYLHYNSNCEALIFRNSSIEEGERLRNELQPESLRLRKQLAALFKKMWPAPAFDEPEHLEAEVVDDKEPSGAADNDKTVIIQNQTNIGNQTVNNFDIKDSDVTFNL